MPRLIDSRALFDALPRLFAPAAAEAAIGLAVSGGADSLALMLLAREWAASLPTAPRLFVYSVDHALRPESAGEAAFVAREATRLGLVARALRWDGAKPQAGVQAAARQARYRLMGEAMRADGARLLLTAHHQDDQAETVLMRLAHGSGLEGLRGMDVLSAVEGVRVFRPLLGVARETVHAVVAEAGISPVTDPSNTDRHYERVRWRQAIPALADAGLDAAALGNFARRAGEAEAALSQWAAEQFAALVEIDELGAASLSRPALLALPRAVGVKLLGGVLNVAGGGQRPRALGAIERLHDRLAATDAMPGLTLLGASVRVRGEKLWVSREPGRAALATITLTPTDSLLWDRRFRIRNRSDAPLNVRMARDFSRRAAEQLLGRSLLAPAAAIRGAPLVSSADGAPLALGGYCLGKGVEVQFEPADMRLPQA